MKGVILTVWGRRSDLNGQCGMEILVVFSLFALGTAMNRSGPRRFSDVGSLLEMDVRGQLFDFDACIVVLQF